jgi:glutamyl-tRNA reductase
MVTLKAEVNSSEGAAFVEAARRFFNLSDPAVSNVNESISSASETCHSRHEESKDAEEAIPRSGSKTPDH